jgi:hypothetical protein
MVILKLDFEKPFDKVEHQVILQNLVKVFHKVDYVDISNLYPGTSAVLLNGTPGKFFHCKRGVRRGDPLSPLLFVIAVDLLQSIINDASSRGLISHPLGSAFGGDFPIVQYADDALLF